MPRGKPTPGSRPGRPLDHHGFSTLGFQLIDWAEVHLCHGPGDLRGDNLALDDELGAFVLRCYQLDVTSGRRIVNRAHLSRAKGRSKSETAAMLVCCELLGPARFDHWAVAGEVSPWGYEFHEGEPVGRPVRDPFIRVLAVEEGQTSNTYNAVMVMLSHLAEHHDGFPTLDVGLTRTFVAGGGEVRPSTAASASKDGGKESFAVSDEVHLFVLPELRAMFDTVSRNLAKRKIAEPWMLSTTTMHQPGQGSVAEQTFEYWEEIQAGRVRNRGLLFDHREGPMPQVWDDDDEVLACLAEAYGAAAAWLDLERILAEIRDPKTSKATAARYFLNRPVAEVEQWLTPAEWAPLAVPGTLPPAGVPITLGFDGSESEDCTALVGCVMETGHLFVLGCWQPPEFADGWSVPRDLVRATVADAFDRWQVARMLCDPPYWQSELSEWAAQHGDKTVLAFPTSQWSRTARAVERLTTAVRARQVAHDGDPTFAEHVFNARCAPVNPRRPELGYVLVKDRRGSPRKIDLAVAAVLAFEARDALVEAGWKPRAKPRALWI